MQSTHRKSAQAFIFLFVFASFLGCGSPDPGREKSREETTVPEDKMSPNGSQDHLRRDSLWKARATNLPDSIRYGTYKRAYPGHVDVHLFPTGKVLVEVQITAATASNVIPSLSLLIENGIVSPDIEHVTNPSERPSNAEEPWVLEREMEGFQWKEVYTDASSLDWPDWFIIEGVPSLIHGGRAWLEGTYQKKGDVLVMDLPRDTMMIEDSLVGKHKASLDAYYFLEGENLAEGVTRPLQNIPNYLDTSLVVIQHEFLRPKRKVVVLLPITGVDPDHLVLSAPQNEAYYDYESNDLRRYFHKSLSRDTSRTALPPSRR